MSTRRRHDPWFRDGHLLAAERPSLRETLAQHVWGVTGRWIPALLLALAACAHVAPPPIPVCHIREPPPVRPHLTPQECPGFEACFTLQDAAALARYLAESATWEREAWGRCGVERPAHAAGNLLAR